MSLITRCPACATMFKVVPDQLRISNGWVRCGQCAEIFDAAQHLLSGAAGAPPPPHSLAGPPQERLPLPGGSGDARAGGASVPDAAPTANAAETVSPSWPAQASPPPYQPPPQPMAPRAERGEDVAAASALVVPALPAADDTRVVPQVPPSFANTRLDHAVEPGSDTAEAPDASFLRKEKGSPVWRRPAVRTTLWVVALVLLALLAVQVLLHERDRVAQIAPGTRPLLLALCSWSGCDLSHPRQIESVVIDSSSFGRIRGDMYRLAFSLRNHAPLDLAMPAIELALTDSQDQALVRRVLLPAEFSTASAVLPAGADWSGSLSLSVKPAAGAERISGYRMLAFYP